MFVIEAETEFKNLILCPKIKSILQFYTHVEPFITYENAVEMGCFVNLKKNTSVSIKL